MINFLPCEPDHENGHPRDIWKGLARQESPSIAPEIIAENEKAWERLRCFPPQWTVDPPGAEVRHVFLSTFKVAVAVATVLVVLFI
jgi:hypothetical protein